ncbi:MAG: hypothetical protein AB7O62_20800 [Pirellulales bacterium]
MRVATDPNRRRRLLLQRRAPPAPRVPTAFQKYGQAPWHVPVGGGGDEEDAAPNWANQPATEAVIKDSPATAMLFEQAADDDAWAVQGLHARWTCESHVDAQSRTLVIV